jgi:hypothetical protein
MTITDILEKIGSFLNFLKVVLSKKTSFSKTRQDDNEKIIILGNGPSLTASLSLLDTNAAELMVVNQFHKTEYFTKLKPKYYIISAPEFWLPMKRQLYIDMQINLEKNLQNVVNWDMVFLIPYASRKYNYKAKIEQLNSKIEVVYYNDLAIDSNSILDNFVLKKKWGMPRPHNVLICALCTGIWLKFKSIDIYGADHSWLPFLTVDKDNNVLLNQKHFYDENTSTYQPMYKRGEAPRKLHEVIQKFYLSFRSYHYIQEWAIREKITIYNCTPNSFIDAFDRK